MQPSPERAEIRRPKDLAVRRQHRGNTTPFTRKKLGVPRRWQLRPMRAIDTMRPADSTPRPRQLLPVANPVARNLPERIAAHLDFGIETRLHQLPDRLRQQRIRPPTRHPFRQDRNLLPGQTTPGVRRAFGGRPGQTPLDEHPMQPRRHCRQYVRSRRGRSVLRVETRDNGGHEFRKFLLLLGHAGQRAGFPPACQRPRLPVLLEL